jgi:hypothetical protein
LSKKLLLIGDLHVGANSGLMPSEASTHSTERERARIVHASPVQMKILNKWNEMIDSEGTFDGIIVNGDICDGYHRKGNGLGCWTTDMDVQVKIAQKMIKGIKVRNNKIYGTQGSTYHTNENISADKLVIEGLGGVFGEDLVLQTNGVRMHFAHKVGVSSSTWQYRSTPIAKELVMAALNEADFGKFNIVARSHAHYFAAVTFSNSLGIICPCFKSRDDFVSRLGLAYNPSIGYVVLDINNDGTYSFAHNIMHLKGDFAIHTHNLEEVTDL